MILPALDRAVLVRIRAQAAQLRDTYAPKTGQTGQTGQHIGTAGEFDAPLGPELTSPHQELTSGTAQRPNPGVQVGSRLDSAHPRPSDGAQS